MATLYTAAAGLGWQGSAKARQSCAELGNGRAWHGDGKAWRGGEEQSTGMAKQSMVARSKGPKETGERP